MSNCINLSTKLDKIRLDFTKFLPDIKMKRGLNVCNFHKFMKLFGWKVGASQSAIITRLH